MNKIRQAQNDAAKKVIIDALIQSNGRIVDAAHLCGVSRQSMWKWIRKFDLDRDQWRIHANENKKAKLPHFV